MQSFKFSYIWRMKAKWCFSTLTIILTLFGICQQQISVPNQEIVLQFTNLEITSDEAQNAIAEVKKQLQIIGVDNIQVRKSEEGRLKITYYSDADVASIEKILSSENTLELGYTSFGQEEHSKFPSDKNSNSYRLDIHEIQDANDADWNLEGIYVLELKAESKRFFNPNKYMSFKDIDKRTQIVKVTYRAHSNSTIAIDNTSRKIPDVRAGPLC